MHHLNAVEKERLKKAVQAVFAVPFIDDLEDFVWEAVFSYVRDVPLVDPLTNIRRKLLFDVIDPIRSIGWSVKALQWTIRPTCEFELVIQRADIFKKSEQLGFEELSRESSTAELGSALLKHWYANVHESARVQEVVDMRVSILLKSTDRKRYAYYEDNIVRYSEKELEWKWTDATKTGLQGIRTSDGFCVFRWYPNQKQLFERFTLPRDVYIFDLSPKRLPLSEAVDLLLNSLSSTS